MRLRGPRSCTTPTLVLDGCEARREQKQPGRARDRTLTLTKPLTRILTLTRYDVLALSRCADEGHPARRDLR